MHQAVRAKEERCMGCIAYTPFLLRIWLRIHALQPDKGISSLSMHFFDRLAGVSWCQKKVDPLGAVDTIIG